MTLTRKTKRVEKTFVELNKALDSLRTSLDELEVEIEENLLSDENIPSMTVAELIENLQRLPNAAQTAMVEFIVSENTYNGIKNLRYEHGVATIEIGIGTSDD